MKLLRLGALLIVQLSAVIGQNLQGSATTLLRDRLLARVVEAPFGTTVTDRFDRALARKEEKYGTHFWDDGYNGFCRFRDNSQGRFLTYHGISEDECMKKCAKENTSVKAGVGALCTAYEYHKLDEKCEIHYDTIHAVKESKGKEVKCVLANFGGCFLSRQFEIMFSKGKPGFSFCRVGRSKGTYTVCPTCKSIQSCVKRCTAADDCVAFEFSEIDGGTCEIHHERPTGVAKSTKKSFCYAKRPQPVNTCFGNFDVP